MCKVALGIALLACTAQAYATEWSSNELSGLKVMVNTAPNTLGEHTPQFVYPNDKCFKFESVSYPGNALEIDGVLVKTAVQCYAAGLAAQYPSTANGNRYLVDRMTRGTVLTVGTGDGMKLTFSTMGFAAHMKKMNTIYNRNKHAI